MKRPSSAPAPASVRALLRHFRAQRPLRAGSLLVTIFGDAIAPRGGAVTLGSLIRLATAFGLTERLVRTSVARLAREGWLAARRSGRRSEYRLTPGGAERFAEATRRIYGAGPAGWDARWTLLVLPAGTPPAAGAQRPARRAELREALKWLGFGALHPTLLAHPSCTRLEARRWLRTLEGGRDALLLECRTGDLTTDRRLAARGWDLKELGRRYRIFLARFTPIEATTARDRTPAATAFLLRTLLIHEYRRIHLQDPLLPPPLLPENWVGAQAYALCRRLYRRLYRAAETHIAATAHRLHGPLRPPSAAARARFGNR